MSKQLQELGALLVGRKLLSEEASITSSTKTFIKDLKEELGSNTTVLVKFFEVKNVGEGELLKYTFVQPVSEEAIEVKAPSAIWAENKDSTKKYISSTVYFVRKIEGGEKYEVTTEEGNERKPFATLSKVDLDKSFTPLQAKQTPDAEGYTKYRDLEEVEAFKYAGDTTKVDETTVLAKGDYLMRKPDGDQFVYEVKKAKDFEAAYTTH